MPITIADALKLPEMSSCKLIGGEGGINRRISMIDTMEVPNIQPWLRKQMLLITTGYSIREDAGALSRLIVDLSSAEAAGLAVKTRFLGEISHETILLADKLNIPLIEIPKEVPFVEITMPLMQAIVDEHSKNLEFSERMNRKFMELELNGGNFNDIAKTLANLIDLPVMILSHTFQLLAVGQTGMKKIPDAFLEKGDFKGQILNSSVAERISEQKIITRLEFETGRYLLVRSVFVKKQIYGYLLVPCEDGYLDDMQMIALNHAVTSVALEISKLQKLEEHLRYLQNNLFLDLMVGNVKAEEEAQSRAKAFRWPSLPIRIAVTDIRQFGKMGKDICEEKVQEIREEVLQTIQRFLSAENCADIVIGHDDNFVMLLPVTVALAKQIAVLSALCVRIKKSFLLDASVGISDPCESYLDIVGCYRDACDAISITRASHRQTCVQKIRDVRLEQALMNSSAEPCFRKCVNDTIGKLEEYDRIHKTEFVKTLSAYVEDLGMRQITAEKLYIHRNTLANRIRKMEEIMKIDLSRNDNLLRLGILLKIRLFL